MRISDWSSDVCSSDLCRSIARNRGCKDALFERDAFEQPVAVRPASSRTPRFRVIGRGVMACHDRMRLAWLGHRHADRGQNQDTRHVLMHKPKPGWKQASEK